MENGQKMFYDFIMERTLEGKKEEMEAVLEDFFKPPQDGEDPAAFHKRIEAITSRLKPEAVPEFQKMMNPFGGDDGEPIEIINPLCQPDREKWCGHYKGVEEEVLWDAISCAERAHEMQCDCWNTRCPLYGDCKKCIVFHLCLRQFPTCQRSLLGDLEGHYIVFSRDK